MGLSLKQRLQQKWPVIKKKLRGFVYYGLPIILSLIAIGVLLYWLYPQETKQIFDRTIEQASDYGSVA